MLPHPHRNGTQRRADERDEERAEGQDEGTERIARDGKQDEGREAARNEMDKKNELPPTCELANLLTCQLANLLTCELAHYTCYAFLGGRLVFRLVPAHSVPRLAIPSRPHRIPVPPGDTRGGAVFSSARLISRVRIPNTPRRFHQLILSDISSSVCNEIFFYLTVAMLNAKK